MKAKKLVVILIALSAFLNLQAQSLQNSMGNLFQLSDAKSRSISPENFTGEKGKAGMATLETGSAARAARELGQGWKVNPYVRIQPGTTFTMADISGSGIINHIWMTPTGNLRLAIMRIYWDEETEPSVEVPVADFFCAGWGMGNEWQISSLAICVNPMNGFNSYWQMPYQKHCRITMENQSDKQVVLYYQIDYSETPVTGNVAFFHAQFRRVNPVPDKTDYTLVDGIKGKGQYVGTYIAHGANSPGWWGEGEMKFFIDGDTQFPTICGTGDEDYFNGSYCYEEWMDSTGQYHYTDFSSPYSGFHHVKDAKNKTGQRRFDEYRWHIMDPVRFEKDLRVTIQLLGWQSEGRYLPLQDDMASVAYWYQTEPHNPFPVLPVKEKLVITY